jgi:hypothetical protein
MSTRARRRGSRHKSVTKEQEFVQSVKDGKDLDSLDDLSLARESGLDVP